MWIIGISDVAKCNGNVVTIRDEATFSAFSISVNDHLYPFSVYQGSATPYDRSAGSKT